MLARCVEQALGAPDQLEKALRRGRRPVSKAASGLGALDALLVRAEREAKDGGAACASVFETLLNAAGRAARKSDGARLDACGSLCRWLCARSDAGCGSLRLSAAAGVGALVAAAASDGDDDAKRWRAVGAAEVARRCCRVRAQRGAPRDVGGAVAALLFAERGAARAFAALAGTGDAPTVSSLAAARAAHEVAHALAVGAEWREAAGRRDVDSDDDDDDDDDEQDEAWHVPGDAFGRRCAVALHGSCLGPLCAVLHREAAWHASATSHRAAFVLAIRDLLAELGADGGSLEGRGSTAARAREDSMIASAARSAAHARAEARAARRDGRDGDGERLEAAADRAEAAARLRLAWLVRSMPPDMLYLLEDGAKDAAALGALQTAAGELGAVGPPPPEEDTSDDSDDEGFDVQGHLRRVAERHAGRADLRRAACRRACAVLGQLKRKRLDGCLKLHPEVQGQLQEACSVLLRGDGRKPGPEKPEEAMTEQRREELKKDLEKPQDARAGFVARCEASTARMASTMLRRFLETVVLDDLKAVENMAAPLLVILDGDHGNDAASTAVGALLAPLALAANSPVLPELLNRCGDKGAALDALERVLEVASAKDDAGGARGQIAKALVRDVLLRPGAHAAARDKAARLFGRLDFAASLPLLCDALKDPATAEAHRPALLAAVGSAVAGAPDAAGALAMLGARLRGDHAAGAEEALAVLPWAEKVLEAAPAWTGRVAAEGGRRWVDAAAGCAAKAANSAKDAAALRVWGACVDALDAGDALDAAVRAVLDVLDAQDAADATEGAPEALVFERLAPLLVLKRLPGALWARSTGAVDGVAAAARRRSVAAGEHKAVKTVAAEILGRLPPSYAGRDAAEGLRAYLAAPSAATADRARVAVYGVCHCAGVHGASATVAENANNPLPALLEVLAAVPTDGDGSRAAEVQRGAGHALAMLVGAEAAERHELSGEKPSNAALVVDVTGAAAAPRPRSPLAEAIGVLGDPRPPDAAAEARLARALLVVAPDETDRARVQALLLAALRRDDGAGVLRIAAANAAAAAAQQLDPAGPLVSLADAVAATCVHHGSAADLGRLPADNPVFLAVATLTRAAWLQALFVVVFRLKRAPAAVDAGDVFGVAVDAARRGADEGVRKGGLTLLATVIAVEKDLFARLPPASGAQALDTLRSLAAADPSKQLRELAASLTTAVEEALGDAPLQRPGAAVDRTAEHPGGLTTPQKPPPVVVEVAPARGDVRLPR